MFALARDISLNAPVTLTSLTDPRLFMLANPMHDAIRRYGLPSAVIDAARVELEAAAKRQFDAGRAHIHVAQYTLPSPWLL